MESNVVRGLIFVGCVTICCPMRAAEPPERERTGEPEGAQAPARPAADAGQTVTRRGAPSVKTPHPLPPDGIESITAECYGHILGPFVTDVAPFTVPTEEYKKLFGYFQNWELDTKPNAESHEHGTMRIKCQYGTTVRICWFWCGQHDRMPFTWNGTRYRTVGEKFADDETLYFDRVVRIIQEKQAAAGKNPAGDVPPN